MLQETFKFEVPSVLNAVVPPERRGIRRDHVKMLVQNRRTGEIDHSNFYQLDRYLEKGDVLVLNSSRTVPAILKFELLREGSILEKEVEIRLARRKSDSIWEALPVYPSIKNGDILRFSKELSGLVQYVSDESPLITIQFSKRGTELYDEIYAQGEPVRYEYITVPWELDYYQTVFATHPGSVEMPSAGRAFSWELLFKLQRRGVKIVFIQLHTGLSYLLDDKWNHTPALNYEEYNISHEAWETILQAKVEGARVVAVGTTVVRCLETAAEKGVLSGWTNLYIHDNYLLKVADGIITGMHEPEASHLELLSAFIQQSDILKAYQEALELGYLWHEFGDMNLLI